MATSNDTRVRVEGFSKISISTASSMPAGLSFAGTRLPAFFMAWPMSMMRLSVLGVDAIDVEEMPRWSAWRLRSLLRDWRLSAARLGRRVAAPRDSRCTASAISPSVTLSGGSRRTTFSPAPTVSSFSAMQRIDHIGHRRLDLDAGQQPAAAHLLDDVGVLVLDARELPA